MMPRRLARLAAIALVVGGSFIGAGVAAAQPAQQPSAAAVSMAKEIMDAKGSFTMFEPLVPGVIETAKNVFLQQSPNLQKDLNEVAATLRAQLAPRTSELKDEIGKLYAARFTEGELKEAPDLLQIAARQKGVAGRTAVRGSVARTRAGMGQQAVRGSHGKNARRDEEEGS